MRRASTLLLGCVTCAAVSCCRSGYEVILRDQQPRTWNELNGSADNGGVSQHGARLRCKRLGLSPEGNPYALWTGDRTGEFQYEVYLRYWDGTAWQTHGGSGSGSGISAGQQPNEGIGTCWGDIAFDADGRPHVTWSSHQSDSQPVVVKLWNGSQWVGLGDSATGISDGATWTYLPDVAIDAQNRPAVVWSQTSDIRLKRFDGNAWVGLDDSHTAINTASSAGPSLASHENSLFVLWDADGGGTRDVRLSRWNGSWAGLGGDTLVAHTESPSYCWAKLRIDSVGAPVVLWSDEQGGQSSTHLRRWNGSSWSAFAGSSSLQDSGVTGASTWHADLDLDDNDNPVVVWEEDDEVGRNIHGAWWTGQEWESLDPDLGGISQTSEQSRWPRVACAQDKIYVSWEQEFPEPIPEHVSEFYLRVLE